jgi:hypothetical protein
VPDRVAQPVLLALLAASTALLAALLCAGLAHPLLWHDEADTAVLGERVLRHGVPQVRGEPALLYDLDPERVDPGSGVYRGGVWGAYYVAALGAALARGSEDFHAQSAWLRLPFAALGLAALCALGLGLAPAAGPGRVRRLAFLAGFALANALSISLLLHLRQVRWYAPAVFLVALTVVLYARRQCLGRLGFGAWCAGSAVCLALLFHVFPPAFGVLGLALAAALALRAARAAAPLPSRLRELSRELAGPALALAAVLPAAFALGLPELLGDWTRSGSPAARSARANLAFVIPNLLRYEWLGPALLAQAGVLAALAARGRAPLPGDLRRRLGVARFLLGFALLYVLVICRKPLLWERYFAPLSPLFAAGMLLDAFALADLARAAGAARARRVAAAALALLAVAAAASAGLRAPELRGRIAEIRRPVPGPLDAIIPYLARRYPDPARLVIATNYEGAAYSYYLKSRVIVGFYGGSLEQDLQQRPDVIVPRPWPRHLRELRELASRADYAPVHFPVPSRQTNGTPSLWPGSLGGVHVFRAPDPAEGDERALLLERAGY